METTGLLTPTGEGEGLRDYWAHTYESLETRLLSYAKRLTNHMTFDAEDLVQDTVYRVLRHPRDPGMVKNPGAYLKATMRNAWIDRRRKESRVSLESIEVLRDKRMLDNCQAPPCVHQTLETAELRQEVEHRQGHLSSREKELLRLYLEGNKCKDIAQILGEDVKLTRSELNAVKSKMRYRLRVASRVRGAEIALR